MCTRSVSCEQAVLSSGRAPIVCHKSQWSNEQYHQHHCKFPILFEYHGSIVQEDSEGSSTIVEVDEFLFAVQQYTHSHGRTCSVISSEETSASSQSPSIIAQFAPSDFFIPQNKNSYEESTL
ncbi:hypothetical protein HZH68_015698 [Vespula germanica]|uniref:Uncharacterized protein n=1 Tax=Vespula germanica TaxID=30212 RepID=A0A834MQX2_VESGE|nr:hypothetical protein HZH68_015698 [Vespula germanica]